MLHTSDNSGWKQVGEMQAEIDMLHQENGIKLKQILDLEEILYATRKTEFDEDCGACWCGGWVQDDLHSNECAAARKATKHLWSK